MGSIEVLLALVLVQGFKTLVWGLNPDDPNVCSHWERWACILWSSPEVALTTFRATKLVALFAKSIQSIIDLTQPESRPARGGAVASDEIRRQIDQYTLIPINHSSHRAWIIISCAWYCHLWEISRNNSCPGWKGEERRLWRYIVWIIAWPRWGT